MSGDRGGLDDLATRLGHRFADATLLERALTHRSYCAEHEGAASNERLEFLGDAVLGWVIADLAFHRHADVPEGGLTDLRKSVVNQAALAGVARELGVGPHLRLGRGEARAGGGDKPSILSDALEAVLGAVYLDGGPDAAAAFVERHVGPRLAASGEPVGHQDHKTRLQERCAALGHPAPHYEVGSTGPDHAKEFTAVAVVEGGVRGRGTGRSKKSAEQAAARDAVEALDARR